MKVLVSFALNTDYTDWKARYDEHAASREAAGIREVYVGHELDDPSQVHALYEADSRAVFDTFMQAPENAAFARASGHRLETTQVVALT
jgi:hypothetical protein